MTLSDWYVLLETEAEKIYPLRTCWVDLVPPDDPATHFQELNASTTPAVDQAVRQFAQTGNWPAMSLAVGELVHLRLVAAADFVEGLIFAEATLAWDRRTQAEWLCWFLLDLWEQVGSSNIQSTLDVLVRPPDNTPPHTGDTDDAARN